MAVVRYLAGGGAGAASRLDAQLAQQADAPGVHPEWLLAPAVQLQDHVMQLKQAFDGVCDAYLKCVG